MPSAIKVFQGDFELFKINEFFNKITKKIEFFNISKFSFQKKLKLLFFHS